MENRESLNTAFEYAKAAHGSINQTRKYSGQPYIIHPMDVVRILENAGEIDPIVLQAAYLHDVIEDVYPKCLVYNPASIYEIFGEFVYNVVIELTDEFTHEKYPLVNRDKRKQMEAERLGKASLKAIKVKLADLISNTSDIVKNDPGFARVYLKEKVRILEAFSKRESEFDEVAKKLFEKASNQIKVDLP